MGLYKWSLRFLGISEISYRLIVKRPNISTIRSSLEQITSGEEDQT
jgi:hypothetical protein